MSVHPSVQHVCWVNEKYISLFEFIFFFIRILTKTLFGKANEEFVSLSSSTIFTFSFSSNQLEYHVHCPRLRRGQFFRYEETLSPSQIFSIYSTTPHAPNLITMTDVGHFSFWHRYWGVTFNFLVLISPTIESTNALQHLFIPWLYIK